MPGAALAPFRASDRAPSRSRPPGPRAYPVAHSPWRGPGKRRKGQHVSRGQRKAWRLILSPSDFIRQLPSALGTPRARELVEFAHLALNFGGELDEWIHEVQGARDSGAIGAAVARFLIFKFVDFVVALNRDKDPRLKAISAHINRIEREHGLKEGEYWHPDEGPAEWQALNREYEAAENTLQAEMFHRFGELELAANPEADGDILCSQGRELIYPPEADGQ